MWGMSNPDEEPGEARAFDDDYARRCASAWPRLVPATASVGLRKAWAATIDFTPDHLPILGPAIGGDGVIDGAGSPPPVGTG